MIRLSGFNYFRQYSAPLISLRGWKIDQPYEEFSYCTDKNCSNGNEHEYAFDGQFFYKKRSGK